MLKWYSLNKLYGGIIGKILLIISISSLLIQTSTYNLFERDALLYINLGCISILLGYIVYIIFIPDIIKIYSSESYISNNLEKESKDYINYDDEFNILENKQKEINKLYIFKQISYSFRKFSSIKDLKEINGKSAIVTLSIIKYAYLNSLNCYMRFFSSLLLFLGLFLLYFNQITNIICYIWSFNE